MKVTRSSNVSLREITRDTFFGICQLSVSPEQKLHVDTVAESLAEANYYLWRLIIDVRYQGMGFGKKVIELVVDFLKKAECYGISDECDVD